MTLSSVSGMNISNFMVEDYDVMYQMSEPRTIMETPFSLPNNNANLRDIMKNWEKELTRFRMTPNQVYEYLVIFACQLYGQEIKEAIPQSLVIMLDQLAKEGKPCN